MPTFAVLDKLRRPCMGERVKGRKGALPEKEGTSCAAVVNPPDDSREHDTTKHCTRTWLHR